MIKIVLVLISMVALVIGGCDQSTPNSTSGAAPPPPSVVTHAVQKQDVSASIDFIGRSEASQRVEVRARVSGVLMERPFKEGEPVAAGDLLFRIDPAEFEAKVASAEADVARADAEVVQAANSLERFTELLSRDVASKAKFDEAKAKDGSAKAQRAAAKAALKTAQLNLGYTKITSPMAGRIGRAKADVGNLIGADTGVLATVVKLDPINVVFAVGERAYLDHMGRVKAGTNEKRVPRIRLANDTLYPHPGTFDLIDNEVDPSTGTISIRLRFPNPDRILVPGQFVKVVLTSEVPVPQVVVPQVAIQENQTGPFVLVVGAKNQVAARPIATGARVGNDIVVTEGLEPGETIIVEGIQKARPGGTVTPVSAEPKQATTSKTE